MDRRIKFRHLEAFSAIARSHSLTRAAERLNLTQPAISKTLKELESIVGVTLMERSRSGARLTPEGEVFLQYTEQSTAALRHGLRSIRSGAASTGRLKIGALPSVAARFLPRALLEFRRTMPDVSVEIYEGPHQDLIRRLHSGDLDLVVGRLGRPQAMTGLNFAQLYSEEVVVVTAPGSPAAAARGFAELSGALVVYPPQDSAIRPLLARLLISQGVALFENRIETTSSSFGRAIVLREPGAIWFISRGVVADDIETGKLTQIDIPMHQTEGAVGIMSRAEEVPGIATRGFCRVVSRVVRDHPAA